MLTPHNVVFIPGWASSAKSNAPLCSALESVWPQRVDVFEFSEVEWSAAFGDAPGGAPSPYAVALHQHLVARNQESATLIGWSTGALIALECAAHFPASVNQLVLLSGTACFTQQDGYSCGAPQAALRLMINGLGKAQPERVLHDFFQRAAAPLTFDGRQRDALVQEAMASGLLNLIAGLRYLATVDLRSHVARLTQPILALHGEHDAIIPSSATEWICGHAPQTVKILLPNAGHALPLLHAEDVAGHLVRCFKT